MCPFIPWVILIDPCSVNNSFLQSWQLRHNTLGVWESFALLKERLLLNSMSAGKWSTSWGVCCFTIGILHSDPPFFAGAVWYHQRKLKPDLCHLIKERGCWVLHVRADRQCGSSGSCLLWCHPLTPVSLMVSALCNAMLCRDTQTRSEQASSHTGSSIVT